MIIKENLNQFAKNPKAIAGILFSILEAEHETDKAKEHFWVVGVNTDNRINYIELVTLGILNSSLVHPREIFRLAIMRTVSAIIIAHNHPSGNMSFSDEDISITRRLIKAGKIIGIKILDHVLIGNHIGNYKSCMDNQICNFNV